MSRAIFFASASIALFGVRGHLHPDKIFIGRIERGFDFLGYRQWGLTVAAPTMERFVVRATPLCEQKQKRAERGISPASSPLGSDRTPLPVSSSPPSSATIKAAAHCVDRGGAGRSFYGVGTPVHNDPCA